MQDCHDLILSLLRDGIAPTTRFQSAALVVLLDLGLDLLPRDPIFVTPSAPIACDTKERWVFQSKLLRGVAVVRSPNPPGIAWEKIVPPVHPHVCGLI